MNENSDQDNVQKEPPESSEVYEQPQNTLKSIIYKNFIISIHYLGVPLIILGIFIAILTIFSIYCYKSYTEIPIAFCALLTFLILILRVKILSNFYLYFGVFLVFIWALTLNFLFNFPFSLDLKTILSDFGLEIYLIPGFSIAIGVFIFGSFYFLIEILYKLVKFNPIIFFSASLISISYFSLTIIFAIIYRFISFYNQKAFEYPLVSFVDAFYFSVITLSTVGYGDIKPNNQIAKLFVTLEIGLGIMVLTLALSILTSFFSKNLERKSTNEP
jgi:Ion channel